LFAWQLHPRWIRHDISVRNFEMKFRHFHPPQGEIAMRSVCSAGGTIMINEPTWTVQEIPGELKNPGK
jgi:hypothetical protein